MNIFNHQFRNYPSTGWLLLLSCCAVTSTASFAAGSSGADTFKTKCAMCHGADASGKTPMGERLKIRDLRSADVQKQSDDELAAIVTNGKPPMPGYAKTLATGDILQLVAYIRSMATKN